MTATSTPTAMPTNESLKAALDSLGRTPKEIAASLAERGHLGLRGHTALCPVAAFVRATFPGYDVVVGRGAVFSGPETEVIMSDALAQLVRDVDRGAVYTDKIVKKVEVER